MAGQDQQFKIAEAFITSDRFLEKEIEVSTNIYEIVIYEDLEAAWLSGSVVITDSTGFMNKIQFKGSEYLTIRLAGAEENSEPIIDKTFLLYQLVKNVKANDASSTYLFNMIELHAFESAMKPFSRAYKGSIEKIISQILNGELNKTVDLSYLTNGVTAQGERRYVVPYLTPLEACETLVDRGTTTLGSPLFLYSSIHDENIRLGDLDRMLTQEAFNKSVPYIYSQSATQSASSLDQSLASTQILGIDLKSNVNAMNQVEEGVLGSFYTNTDVSTGVSYRARVSFKETFANLQKNEIIDPSDKQDVYDVDQLIGGESLDTYNSIYWHQVSSSNLYLDYKSYHDDNTNSEFALKVKNTILRQTLLSNMISIVVPGIAFLFAKATVGDILSMNILSPIDDPNEIYDEKLSGDYLVYRTKHVFRETSHNITCDITKISQATGQTA